ncbi:hypothetical protein MHM582_2095, partial [Microbacterium sp. HM58-2]
RYQAAPQPVVLRSRAGNSPILA